jgi:hypothetical protein
MVTTVVLPTAAETGAMMLQHHHWTHWTSGANWPEPNICATGLPEAGLIIYT